MKLLPLILISLLASLGLLVGCAVPKVQPPALVIQDTQSRTLNPHTMLLSAPTPLSAPKTYTLKWATATNWSTLILSSQDLQTWKIELIDGKELTKTNQLVVTNDQPMRFYKVVNLITG